MRDSEPMCPKCCSEEYEVVGPIRAGLAVRKCRGCGHEWLDEVTYAEQVMERRKSRENSHGNALAERTPAC